MGSILHLGFHIGAQTSTMSFYLTFATMRTTWSTRKSAREKQEQDTNVMKLQIHFPTKLWDALLSDQRNPACDDLGNWAVLCPSCSNWRDTLRLKICGMLRRLLSSDRKSNHEEADRKFCSFVLHVIIFNYITGISTRFGARLTFQKRCIGTQKRQDEGWSWRSTGPCLYDPRSNPRGLSGANFKLVRHYWAAL